MLALVTKVCKPNSRILQHARRTHTPQDCSSAVGSVHHGMENINRQVFRRIEKADNVTQQARR